MAFSAFSAPYTRSEFPQESQVFNIGPLAAADLNNITRPILVLDRECDIEAISVRATTAGSDFDLTFRVAPSGTAAASGTQINAADESAADLTGNATYQSTLNRTGSPHLNVAAGSVLSLFGASGLGTLAGLMVTVRTRTRKVRTNDAGNKEFPQQ